MASIDRLLEIMARLRDPEHGCPWDVAQSFRTIAPYTIEEAYEVADAIDRKAWDDLVDELGDLLLQVVFHAQMAEEAGYFRFADVVRSICDKMERRHPHVFGEATIEGAEAQAAAWEAHKAAERARRGDRSALAGIARGLPEWLRAEKLQRRAARVGFDWDRPADVFDKLDEEVAEMREAASGAAGQTTDQAEHQAEDQTANQPANQVADQNTDRATDRARDPVRAAGAGRAHALEDEFGDFLFTALNLARHLGLDAGRALRGANARFERRFRAMEDAAQAAGEELAALSAEALEALWQAAKRRVG